MARELSELIREQMVQTLEREIQNKLFGNYSTATNAAYNPPLTLDVMQELLDKWVPVLYYATDTNTERGKLIIVKAGDFHPEFIVFHPDDMEEVKAAYPARQLKHVKDEPKEDVWKRIKTYAEKHYQLPESW